MSTQTTIDTSISHRQVARLSGILYLRSANILTQTLHLDLISAIVLMNVSRINLAALRLDLEKAKLYAGVDRPIPDELREPVSAYALALEAGIPYETTRRHLVRLVKQGFCRRVESGGFIVCQGFLTTQMAITMGDQTLVAVTEFVRGLGEAGLSVPATGEPLADPRLHVSRLNARNFLGLAGLLETHAKLDLISGLVMMAIISANTAPILSNPELAKNYASLDNVVPDQLRKPVTVYSVSKMLGLPYETARRYVAALTEAGACSRVLGGGIVAPGMAQGRPVFFDLIQENALVVHQYLTDLAAIGISGEALAT